MSLVWKSIWEWYYSREHDKHRSIGVLQQEAFPIEVKTSEEISHLQLNDDCIEFILKAKEKDWKPHPKKKK